MRTHAVTFSRWVALAWPAAFAIAGLTIVGSAGWLWFFSAADSTWGAVPLVGVVALAGITWCVSHARADRRWRAALDRYAEQEQAKRTYSWRDSHARPQWQARRTIGGATL
jgi:hypothetical protein